MKTEAMPVLVVEGSPRERGRSCGEALRRQIAECFDAIEHVGETQRGIPAKQFREQFLNGTSFRQTIDRWTPELLDEVKGLSEGADQPFERMFYAQLMDEEWWYVRNRQHAMAGDAGHCTGFAVRRDDRTIVAQNMDLGQWLDDHQAVVRHIDRQAGFDIQVLTFAGYLGLCGMNRTGPAVCCNTLLDLDSNPAGLPVAFIFRRLVQSPSAAAAVDQAKSFPHASGQNYIIGDREDVQSLECSAHQVTPFRPQGSSDRVYHTNHALANTDAAHTIDPAKSLAERCGSPSSPARLASVSRRIDNRGNQVDITYAMETLRAKDNPSQPVCRDGNNTQQDAQIGFTFGSVICEISDDPAMHVAAGPPCHASYRKLDFSHSPRQP